MENYDYKIDGIPNAYLRRTGTCQPEKCGGVCCKFYSITKDRTDNLLYDYIEGFFEIDKFDNFILKKPCRQLTNDNKCKLWDTDRFPAVCQQFPHVTDPVYHLISDVCTFKFELIFKEKNQNRDEAGKELFSKVNELFKETYEEDK